MTRFITMQSEDGMIQAFADNENWQQAQDAPYLADWVWQFADSKEQAIAQHEDKIDEWQNDYSKETY